MVQLSNRSRLTVKNGYVVEHAELPIVDLLAQDKSLIRSLIEVTAEEKPGTATGRFLRNMLSAAARTDELDPVEHGTIPRAPRTSIFGLFGVDVVDRASAVMIGHGNQLTTDMKVDRGTTAVAHASTELAR